MTINLREVMDVQWVRVAEVNVHPAAKGGYQRELKKARVGKLAKEFDPGAIKALSLARRSDGSLWCYDGMHTLALARVLGIEEIPAVGLKNTVDLAQEAKLFLKINGGSEKVKQQDKQAAGIVAKDKIAIAAQALLDEYGITVSTNGIQAGKTNAIGAIRRYVAKDRDALVLAMSAIDALWSVEAEAWSGLVIRGMFEMAREAKTLEKMREIRAKLRAKKVTPRRILDVASAMQIATGAGGGGAAYAKKAIKQLCGVTE